MRVSTYDPRSLVLDRTPWVMGAGFVVAMLVMLFIALRALARGDLEVAFVTGLGALILPGGAFAVLSREQLILDRDLGEVVVRRRNLLRGLEETRHPLTALRGAVVERSDSRLRERMHRMALVLGPPIAPGEESVLHLPPFVDWGDEGTAVRGARIVEAWLAGETQPVFGKRRRGG